MAQNQNYKRKSLMVQFSIVPRATSCQHLSAVLGLLSVAFLSGCMGDGATDNFELSILEERESAATLVFASQQPVSYTDLAMVPVEGAFEYSGYVLGQLSNTDDQISDKLSGLLIVQVDFASPGLLEGRAFDFLDDEGRALDGEILISSGTLDRSADPAKDSTLEFEGSGILTDGQQQMHIGATFQGDFLNSDASAIFGNVVGRVSVGGEIQYLGGAYIATLQ